MYGAGHTCTKNILFVSKFAWQFTRNWVAQAGDHKDLNILRWSCACVMQECVLICLLNEVGMVTDDFGRFAVNSQLWFDVSEICLHMTFMDMFGWVWLYMNSYRLSLWHLACKESAWWHIWMDHLLDVRIMSHQFQGKSQIIIKIILKIEKVFTFLLLGYFLYYDNLFTAMK